LEALALLHRVGVGTLAIAGVGVETGTQKLGSLVCVTRRPPRIAADIDYHAIKARGICQPLSSIHGSQKSVQSEFIVVEGPQLKDSNLGTVLSLHKKPSRRIEIVVHLNGRPVARQPGYTVTPVTSEVVSNKR
jgi:hypothetical protein